MNYIVGSETDTIRRYILNRLSIIAKVEDSLLWGNIENLTLF